MEVMRKLLWRILPTPIILVGILHMRIFGCNVDGSAKIFGRPMLWRNRGSLRIGKRVELHSIRAMAMVGQEFPCCSFATAPGGRITIDDDSVVVASAFFAAQEISIGKRVMIAAGCRVLDSNMHPTDEVPRRCSKQYDSHPIVIEDDVWLCNEVMVCPGVRIGKGSVIAAKSVVTKDIPPMVVAAGAPAVAVRKISMR